MPWRTKAKLELKTQATTRMRMEKSKKENPTRHALLRSYSIIPTTRVIASKMKMPKETIRKMEEKMTDTLSSSSGTRAKVEG